MVNFGRANAAGLLSTREVAERCGVTTSTVRTWKERGRLVPVANDPAIGNLYAPDDVAAVES